MKRLIVAALLALSSSVFATTLTPIQLLNPTGSTAGQAIVSTGSSSAPAWGSVTAASLAAQAANTVVANVTGASASPTAVAIPSCSSTSSALQYTSGTGFSCYASSASTATANTWALGQTFSAIITPSTTNGIKGTTAGDNANAGSDGEVLTSVVSTNTTWSPATNVSGNTNCQIPLTAGDWNVTGSIFWAAAAGSGAWTAAIGGISTTSATQPATPYLAQAGQAAAGVTNVGLSIPMVRVNVASSATAYLVGTAGYSSGTMAYQCQLIARRVR